MNNPMDPRLYKLLGCMLGLAIKDTVMIGIMTADKDKVEDLMLDVIKKKILTTDESRRAFLLRKNPQSADMFQLNLVMIKSLLLEDEEIKQAAKEVDCCLLDLIDDISLKDHVCNKN